MQWEFVIALVIAIPVILFPAAFVWYLNISGIYKLIKESTAEADYPPPPAPYAD